MEAMWTYCNPLIRRITELVRDGAIGEIRTVQADFGFAGTFGAEHRLRDPALGGGALLDLGVYPVSFAQLLLGEPDRVQADALLSPEGVDLNTGMLLGWDSGATALLSCSIVANLPTSATVTGTEGRIDLPGTSSTRTTSSSTGRAGSRRRSSRAPARRAFRGCSTRRPR